MITVIDYKYGGNIFSVMNSLASLGIQAQISSDPQQISSAHKILFPGVGSFETAMQQIHNLKLQEVILDKALSDTPFLGICVGMQVMFEYGSESQSGKAIQGLGILAGTVSKFTSKAEKIPHMGWNHVNLLENTKSNPLFIGINNHSDFYFVHSYRADAELIPAISQNYPEAQFATTEFGDNFISHFWNGRKLFACQFHPEKSGPNGLKLLENFARL